MKKHFQVPISLRPFNATLSVCDSEDASDPLHTTYSELSIEAVSRVEEVHRVLIEYYRDNGEPAGYLLLGWETWLQLGWELSNRIAVLKPESFASVPIIVDPERKQLARCIPGPDRVINYIGRTKALWS